MKNEFHGRRNQWSGFPGRSLVTLVLVFGLIISTPFFSKAATERFDARACSLTIRAVNADNEEEFPGLADADLVIDLYKVAEAVPISGSDGYTYNLLSPYTELEITNDMTGDQWRTLSQQAAGIIFDVETGAAKETPFITGRTTDAIEGIEAGLYLLIARSDDIDKYVTTTKEGDIVTRALAGSDSYLFLPELVSLPSKEPDEDGRVSTINPGDWQYDMTVYLKPERDIAYGSLRIGKILERYYVNGGPATFVFDVEAVLNDKVVYSNVVTIVFDDSGSKEILIEKIPVGAMVTVTEVYSGACYTVEGTGVQTTEITADLENPASVEFKNDYNERQTGGSGITNHFSYNTETNQWNWDKIENRSQR